MAIQPRAQKGMSTVSRSHPRFTTGCPRWWAKCRWRKWSGSWSRLNSQWRLPRKPTNKFVFGLFTDWEHFELLWKQSLQCCSYIFYCCNIVLLLKSWLSLCCNLKYSQCIVNLTFITIIICCENRWSAVHARPYFCFHLFINSDIVSYVYFIDAIFTVQTFVHLEYQ